MTLGESLDSPSPCFPPLQTKGVGLPGFLKVSSTVKLQILELAFKEMTGCVTHSDSFGITVKSLWGLEMGGPRRQNGKRSET